MKSMKSFRLSDDVVSKLDYMAARYGLNNTQVLERAINFYYSSCSTI